MPHLRQKLLLCQRERKTMDVLENTRDCSPIPHPPISEVFFGRMLHSKLMVHFGLNCQDHICQKVIVLTWYKLAVHFGNLCFSKNISMWKERKREHKEAINCRGWKRRFNQWWFVFKIVVAQHLSSCTTKGCT